MGSVSPVPSHPVPSSASPIPSRPFRSRLALFSAHVASPLTGRLPHLSRAKPVQSPLGRPGLLGAPRRVLALHPAPPRLRTGTRVPSSPPALPVPAQRGRRRRTQRASPAQQRARREPSSSQRSREAAAADQTQEGSRVHGRSGEGECGDTATLF